MTWTANFVTARETAKANAQTRCSNCGGGREVGFSTLGVPMAICPTCQPEFVATPVRAKAGA